MSTATLKVLEVAEELRVNRQHVYRLIWSGALSYTNISTGTRPKIRISRTALERFIRSREKAAAS